LEARDRPSEEIRLPSGIASLYLRERRAGSNHTDARRAAGHGFGHRGQALDIAIERAVREFESELEAVASRPADEPTTMEVPA
jgi:hypothetical protein